MTLLALLSWSFSVLQLRGTPADAPPSQKLLLQLLLLDLVSSVLYLEAIGTDYTALALAGRLLLRLGSIWLVLRVFGHEQRFLQTSITLYAVSALLTFIMLPIAGGLVRSPTDDPDLFAQILQLGFLTLLLWSIVVDAHVLRHALGIKFWWALALAMGLFMVYNELAELWFPLP
jgi:hypothetical protein